jgi:hypothetical protein
MSLDFFRIERGLELDELVQYLQGAGAPGTGGDTAAALVGSVYTDNTDGAIYTKITAGTGTDKWQKLASESYVNNAVGATISWREPAVVRDNTATSLLVGTPTQPITVDGISITNNQRVLFAALTGGDGKNIYIYDQANGVFVEDTNNETNGDAVYIQSGTSAGKTFVFNSTNWVQSDQSSLDEDGYIRAFIGKVSSGIELPNYSSNNFVVDSTSLKDAISALDLELGPNVSTANFITAANKINQNIQSLDTEIGPNVTDGGWILAANSINQNLQSLDTHLGVPFLAGNFISANQTVYGAVTALDVELGPNVVNGNFILAANKINQNIQSLDTQLGANVINGGYILAANSTNTNVQALDAALTAATQQVSVTNVTSIQTIDTAPVGVNAAKWFVRAELVSDVTRVYATEVYAVSNGTTSDFTRYATLRLGTAIPGLVVTVDLDGSNNLRVRVASTGAVNVTTRRASVLS